MRCLNQKGAAPLLILLAIIGVVALMAVSYTAPFKNSLLSAIFPKDESNAAVGDLSGSTFLETFTHIDNANTPSAPKPWTPENWSVFSNNPDNIFYFGNPISNNNPYYMETMQAHHGADCSKPINDTNPGNPILVTHTVSDMINNVYLCRNHMMTAINHSGYGAVYFVPNHMIDFSQGEATFKFDMSTFRSSTRDWVDFWITPFEDNLVGPINEVESPYAGDPKRSVHITEGQCGTGGCFAFSEIINNHDGKEIRTYPGGNSDFEMSLEDALKKHGFKMDAARRDTLELKLSKTHIKFCMTSINTTPPVPVNECFINHPIPNLGWDKGIVQLAHHGYNPEKGENPSTGASSGSPNTWHWDNVYISPAIPFTMLNGTPDLTMYDSTNKEVTFKSPSPANAFLRFAASGNNIQFSINGGSTWTNAQRQVQEKIAEANYNTYWTPIPQGVTKISVRGQGGWWGEEWAVSDASIWSLTTPGASQAPSAQPSPSVAPSLPPSPVVTPTATPVPSVVPSASARKPGDVDGNNRVDIFDYNQLLTDFGKTGINLISDIDKTGTSLNKVDIFDFNMLLSNFNR